VLLFPYIFFLEKTRFYLNKFILKGAICQCHKQMVLILFLCSCLFFPSCSVPPISRGQADPVHRLQGALWPVVSLPSHRIRTQKDLTLANLTNSGWKFLIIYNRLWISFGTGPTFPLCLLPLTSGIFTPVGSIRGQLLNWTFHWPQGRSQLTWSKSWSPGLNLSSIYQPSGLGPAW
jgi:hypothetical protein